MKRLITDYTFDASARTVTLTGKPTVPIEGILLITNVTVGAIIYLFNDPTKGGTVSGNVITLDYNTTAMSDDDDLQVFYDDGVTDIEALVDPTSGRLAVDVGEEPIAIRGNKDLILSQEETGELSTFDKNLERVFGSNPLISQDGKLIVQSLPTDKALLWNIYTANSLAQMSLTNMATAVIQLAGTFAGTITFEGTVNNADWVSLVGMNIAGVAGQVSTSTAAGIFRFDVVGLKGIRARYTTYTSGTCQVMIVASAYPDPVAPGTVVATVTGTATTTETQVSPVAVPGRIAPTAPTLPTAGVAPWAYLTPQIYARIRVEAGGSERLPFKQIPFTNELSVQDVPGNVMLEKLYVQLTLFMQAMMNVKDVSYPDGWDLIK